MHFLPVPTLHHFALAAAALSLGLPAVHGADKAVASFLSEEDAKSWVSVNDGVMGGVSKGGFSRSEQGTLLFTGELSLENNGGFASIRMKEADLGLDGTKALVVKARGDGRTYWVDLRATNQMAASSYRAFLPTTAGKFVETTIPYTEFKLQAFGRELPIKPLNPASIASVGITLADKKEGAFSLEIESVKATSDAAAEEAAKETSTLVDAAKAAGQFKTLLAAAAAADLVGVLSGEGPFTLLAPTDAAFAKLPAGALEKLLLPESKEQLVAILKNHVIAGRITLPQALEAREAPSLQGSKIPFKFDDGRVQIGAASLLKSDLAASNGIIHVIDQVLIPETKPAQPLTASGLIELAISRGVPAFNDGNVAECAAIYEITLEALLAMEGVSDKSRAAIAGALKKARAESSARKQAWLLRGALDASWESFQPAK